MLRKPISYILPILLLLAVSCGKSEQEKRSSAILESPELKEIEQLESKLKQLTDLAEAQVVARELAKKLLVASDKYEKDSIAANLLYKIARIEEHYFQDYTEAFGIYHAISEDYPDTRFGAVSIFKQGLLMETYFHKSDKAIYYMDEFLRKNPEHKLAKMAIDVIKSAGVDPEKLMERIEMEQKEESEQLEN